MDKKVIFTIIQCGHGVYRIITNHMQFKKNEYGMYNGY